MAAVDVEFIDSEPAGAGDSALGDGSGTWQSRASAAPRAAWAAIGLWTAAAVLGLLSTFQNLFTYRFDFGTFYSRGGYNALGYSLNTTLNVDRWPEYGFALASCAAVFAFLAAGLARAALTDKQSRLQRQTDAIGIAAVSLLFGVMISMALALNAEFVTDRGLARTMAGRASAVRLSLGACVWLAVGSLGCATAALVFTMLSNRRRG